MANKKLHDYLNEEEVRQLEKCIDGELDLLLNCHDLYEKLLKYYADEIPYETVRRRTGDPVEWILEHAEREV